MSFPQPIPNILGFLVPGGPVRTDFIASDATKLTLTLHAPGDLPIPVSSVSDVVCFVLPNAPLPPNHGLLIYWQVLTPTFTTGFELLGSLTPDRPSCIFRTNWSQHEQVSTLVSTTPTGTPACQVVLGVSIERLEEIQNLPSESYDSRLFVAQKIATDLFRFMQSFDTGGATTNNGQLVVPTNIFDRWMRRFEAKYRRDPNFFMKQHD